MNTRPAAILLIVLAFTLVGCKEEGPVDVNRARSYLHISSAAEGNPFDVTFDYYNADNVVIEDFFFKRNFPNVGYANLEATDELDQFGNGAMWLSLSRQPFVNQDPDTILQPSTLSLIADERASLFFVDSLGSMTLLKLVDNFSFTDADTDAKIRFINLASEVDAAGIESLDGNINQTGIGFLQNTDFMNVGTGNQDIEITDAGGNVIVSQTFSFFPRAAYTIYLGGNGNGSLGWYRH